MVSSYPKKSSYQFPDCKKIFKSISVLCGHMKSSRRKTKQRLSSPKFYHMVTENATADHMAENKNKFPSSSCSMEIERVLHNTSL